MERAGGGNADGGLAGGDVPSSATGVLTVDLAALKQNYRALAARAGRAECAAVVKGDGYGLGAAPIASALFSAGCRTFFVATLSEAEALRGALKDAAIYVLDGLFPESAPEFHRLDVQPVLGDLAEIGEWAAFCRAQGRDLPAAIHIDTGMNRLGLKAADQRLILSDPGRLGGFTVSLLMSHLACADTPDHPKNAEQRESFAAFAANLPPIRLSLANSAGIFLGPETCLDLVRPGIALYGGNPFSSLPNPMKPVIRLYGRIAQIGEALAGETVGYGAAETLKRRTRYATVGVGYADGYPRALGSSDAQPGAIAYLGDRPLPLIGRVSMDLIVVDVTDAPPALARRGGFVELIGPRFTVDDAASIAGTIGYEILTSLGPRYHRVYLDGGEGAPLT